MAALQDDLFTFDVDGAHDHLVVAGFSGAESISAPYCFKVRVERSPLDAKMVEEQYIGKACHLGFGEPQARRWIHGVVRSMTVTGALRVRPQMRLYTMEMVPRLALVSLKRNSRIFQDKSTGEIVSEVLSLSGVDVSDRSASDLSRREYCVQYQETDLAFVERILSEDGIFYFFEQSGDEQGKEVLVLASSASACAVLPDAPKLHPREDYGQTSDAPDVHRFSLERRVQPGSVVVKDFDFNRPSLDLRGEAKEGEEGEQYHHEGALEPVAVSGALATVRLEQHRRTRWVARGETENPALAAGAGIQIVDADLEPQEGTYTVVSVEHEARSPHYDSGGPDDRPYRNTFSAVPSTTVFRPEPPAPRFQQVLETAVVVGPPGNELFTDELGRIKVQFHWDRDGKLDGATSCWLRVMQPWAGAGWGFQFIPRIGMEVLVAFLGGDVDRPIVIGSVPNREHPPLYAQGDKQTRSGIRTRSMPGGKGYNELAFEDKQGEEAIDLRAEKHLNETVGANHVTTVAQDRTLTIGGNRSESVAGQLTLSVGADRHDVVHGNWAEDTTGNVSSNVVGNRTRAVAGVDSLEVTGAATAHYHATASVRVDQGASVTAIDGLGVNVGVDTPASANLHATGSWNLGADQDLILHAERSVTIQCGDSVLRMTPDRVEITAKEIVVSGSESTLVRSEKSIVALDGEAKIAAPAARFFGTGSSLELTKDVYAKGASIKLNYREGDPPSATSEEAQAETQPFKLKLSDGAFQPYANRPYELTVDGRRYSGTTSGDGTVTEDIPKGATKAHLVLWEGEPPAGKSHVWDVVIADPASASTTEGARTRLANLGYETGAGPGLDPQTKQAIADFQEDHDLEPTGELDAATATKLSEVHGH
ncbi:MAG: type VI secretion system tip protein TssI/VgrG [Polyangiaceae bacterium]